VIMYFGWYPCLHLYIRDFNWAANLGREPTALDVIMIMNRTRAGTAYVLTKSSLTESLEKTVEEFNWAAKPFGLGEPWFKPENLKCTELLKDPHTYATLYRCTVKECGEAGG